MEKPKSIKLAIKLMYLVLFLNLINSLVEQIWIKPVGNISHTTAAAHHSLIFTIIISFLANFLFIYMVSRGKKWARTVYLILFILGAIAGISSAIFLLILGIYFIFIVVVIIVTLQLIAVIKLFSKNGNEYFITK